MRKFFVKENQIKDNNIEIIGTDVNHIKNVLRLNIDEDIMICDSDNNINYISKIISVENNKIICNIQEVSEGSVESNIEISIFQGIPKFDKMELIIQKGTELGVKDFTPISFERCVVKLQGKDESKKIDRWQKIAQMASEQSGRDIIPKINGIKSVKNICEEFSKYDIVLVAYEQEKENSLKSELKKLSLNNDKLKIAVVIGPEGGISENEINIFKQAGAKIITLGNRILRTETVCLMCTSIIMYELEN